MNFVIVVQSDPIYTKIFFGAFLQNLTKSSHSLIGVVIQPTLNENSKITLGKQIYRTFGLKYTAFLAAVHLSEKLSDILRLPFNKSLKRCLIEKNIPVMDFKSVNSNQFYQYIEEKNWNIFCGNSIKQIPQPCRVFTKSYL